MIEISKAKEAQLVNDFRELQNRWEKTIKEVTHDQHGIEPRALAMLCLNEIHAMDEAAKLIEALALRHLAWAMADDGTDGYYDNPFKNDDDNDDDDDDDDDNGPPMPPSTRSAA